MTFIQQNWLQILSLTLENEPLAKTTSNEAWSLLHWCWINQPNENDPVMNQLSTWRDYFLKNLSNQPPYEAYVKYVTESSLATYWHTVLSYYPNQLSNDKSNILEVLASRTDSSPGLLDKLARSGDRDVKKAVANNPLSPASALEFLAKDNDEFIRLAVVNNPSTPSYLLAQLAIDQELAIREVVANKSNVSSGALRKIWAKHSLDSDIAVLLALAANQSTPSDVLRVLARHTYNEDIQLALAKNCSTPRDVLENMWGKSNLLIAIAKNKNTPERILLNLIKATQEQSVFMAAINNKSISIANLEKLLEELLSEYCDKYYNARPRIENGCMVSSSNNHSEIRELIIGVLNKISYPPVILLDTLTQGVALGSEIVKWIAGNIATPVKVLEYIFENINKYQGVFGNDILCALAGNKLSSYKIIEVLSEQLDSSILKSLALNTSTPFEILQKLAENKNSPVRAAVAQSTTSPELLEYLARNVDEQEEDLSVICAIASNPFTPLAILKNLIQDYQEQWQVLEAMSENSAIITALQNVSTQDDWQYRWLDFTENPTLPTALIERLVDLEDISSCLNLAKHPNTPDALKLKLFKTLIRAKGVDFRINIAKNTATPQIILNDLAGDEEDSVRRAVASNSAASPSLLRQLAGDAYLDVRCAVASNQFTPAEILEEFLWDCDYDLRAYAQKNPNTPYSALKTVADLLDTDFKLYAELLLKKTDDLGWKWLNLDMNELCHKQSESIESIQYPVEQLRYLQTRLRKIFSQYYASNTDSAPLRLAALLCPECSVSILEKNIHSNMWQERCAIAINANTPIKTIKILSEDGHALVKNAAINRLAHQI